MAWKGLGDDAKLYWSSLHGGSWTAQQVVADGSVGLDPRPALAVVLGSLIMTWKAIHADPRIFGSRFHDNSWSNQQQIVGGTSHGRALASSTVVDL